MPDVVHYVFVWINSSNIVGWSIFIIAVATLVYAIVNIVRSVVRDIRKQSELEKLLEERDRKREEEMLAKSSQLNLKYAKKLSELEKDNDSYS